MDVTFWVIQVVLLAPVLFMAASAGKDEHEDPYAADEMPPLAQPSGAANIQVRRRLAARVSTVVGELGQFSVEQQARLVLLRCMVQEARLGRGTLIDDLLADDPPPQPQQVHKARARQWASRRQLVLAGSALLMGAVGMAGVVRTNFAIDELQRASEFGTAGDSGLSRLLPGAIANPAKYLSALNGGVAPVSPGAAASDPLFAAGFVNQKQAMDRWEAVVAIGLSLLLFVNATRGSPAAAAGSADPGQEKYSSSVAFDLAPFMLVAAVLFAALSFFEIP